VLTPNGGEFVSVGSVLPITWSSTGSAGNAVNITVRRGTISAVIASGTSNDGSFNWTVPLSYTAASDYRIEISSAATPSILDTSNSTFTISQTGSITVLSPSGGEVFTLGASQRIVWASTGEIGDNVKIVARRGTSSAVIVASTPNDGVFDWTVPLNYPLSNDFIVEISSVSYPSIFDTSEVFSVQAADPVGNSITVLSPNGGESVLRGSVFPITWSHTGDVGNYVKIYIRKGTAGATVVSSTSNDGRFDWIVPNYTLGTGYSIEVSSVLDPTLKDTSDATFSLTDTSSTGRITVTSPNGGESFLQGATIPITWTTTGTVGSSVEILAHGAGQTLSVHSATANDGAYNWQVPESLATGSNYTIEVRSLSNATIQDSSNNAFTIAPLSPDSITVVYPNGGETLVRGQTAYIRWVSTGTVGANVVIIARKGTSSGTISSGTPNDGIFAWTIPANYVTGSGLTIEIRSATAPSILDTSDSSFTIAP